MRRVLRSSYCYVIVMESFCGCSAWFQRELFIKPRRRGCHLITDEIEKLEDIKNIKIGLCHILSKHNFHVSGTQRIQREPQRCILSRTFLRIYPDQDLDATDLHVCIQRPCTSCFCWYWSAILKGCYSESLWLRLRSVKVSRIMV